MCLELMFLRVKLTAKMIKFTAFDIRLKRGEKKKRNFQFQ